MTLDPKGLEAAEAAWRASVEPTCKLMLSDAITAYLATSKPRVKPLGFEWAGEQCTVRYAASVAFWVGYRIGLRSDGRKALHVERIGGEDRLGDYTSWDEAEAAAQADYEDRILSALEITP